MLDSQSELLFIDGSTGEGGGQILRSSLALSLATGTPFRIENIRAGRKKPGLRRQHLTAVQAAASIGCAKVEGAAIGSKELTFVPGEVITGDYHFSVGTAGSATLVLQTVLPPLLIADGPCNLLLEGGTHNPFAPPFDFLEKSFLPIIQSMGPVVVTELERHGFYPAGGGKFRVRVEPVNQLKRIELLERGPIKNHRARAIVSALPSSICKRELDVIGSKMSWKRKNLIQEEVANPQGPGNVVIIELESEHVTEVVTSFGSRGVKAEAVAHQAVKSARLYIGAEAPVGEFLADQLLLPFSLAGGGSFKTMALSRHAKTNILIIEKFLPVKVQIDQQERNISVIEVVPLT